MVHMRRMYRLVVVGNRDGLLALIAPTILFVVAAFQIWSAHAHALSPWKGGGFGMFSTVDSPAARFVRIYVFEGFAKYPVPVPEELSRDVREVRTIPTPERLQRLAGNLSDGQWVEYSPMSATSYYSLLTGPPLSEGTGGPEQIKSGSVRFVQRVSNDEIPLPTSRVLKATGIAVELWSYSFDSRRNRLEAIQLSHINLPLISRAGTKSDHYVESVHK
jgi:hypothetical protein